MTFYYNTTVHHQCNNYYPAKSINVILHQNNVYEIADAPKAKNMTARW